MPRTPDELKHIKVELDVDAIEKDPTDYPFVDDPELDEDLMSPEPSTTPCSIKDCIDAKTTFFGVASDVKRENSDLEVFNQAQKNLDHYINNKNLLAALLEKDDETLLLTLQPILKFPELHWKFISYLVDCATAFSDPVAIGLLKKCYF